MDAKKSGRGVSKRQWLEAGLDALARNGTAGLTVDGLARSLGIARAGFYWHFKNRDELLRRLLDYWLKELTEVITENADVVVLEPRERLATTAELVLDHGLARYDMAIRQWALTDAEASRAVRKVDRIRMNFVRSALRELGFTGNNLEMRAMLFLCYQTWEPSMFGNLSKKRRRELIATRIEILTGQ